MTRMTKTQIQQKLDTLQYTVDVSNKRLNEFRKWHQESLAKTTNLAEALQVVEAAYDSALTELGAFRNLHKM